MLSMLEGPAGFTAKDYEDFCNKMFYNVTGKIMPTTPANVSLVMGLYINHFFLNIINTEVMQNCGQKIQTAYSYKTNPRMELCTRLDHMIYAFVLGLDFLMIEEKKGVEIDDKTKISFLTFLLLHDVGHGPFSHPFEVAVGGYKGMHEDIGKRTILENKELYQALENIYEGLANDVVNFKENDKYGLSSLLEGIFDFDRAAFLIADTFECDSNNHPSKNKTTSRELKQHIYQIMNSIILKDGKTYYDESCLGSVEFFLKTRKENYEFLYYSYNGILYDKMLSSITQRVVDLNLDKLEYYENDRNAIFYDRIVNFTKFIREMKEKQATIDINWYHKYNDNDFNEIFYILQLVDDYDLNKYCRICTGSIEEMMNNYFMYEIDTEERMEEFKKYYSKAFAAKSKVKVYEPNDEENIRFIGEDGTIIDLEEHPDRKLDISTSCKYYGYLDKKAKVLTEEEYEIFFKIAEDTIKKELEDARNRFSNISGELANNINSRIMHLREFFKNGGNIAEYVAINGITLREFSAILLMGAKTKKLRTCATLLLTPQNELGNTVLIAQSPSVEEKEKKIREYENIIINDNPDESDNNYNPEYVVRNTMFTTDDNTSLFLYKPLLNKTANYSQNARKQIEELFSDTSLKMKAQNLVKTDPNIS